MHKLVFKFTRPAPFSETSFHALTTEENRAYIASILDSGMSPLTARPPILVETTYAENGDFTAIFNMFSEDIAVLERLMNEQQDPTSNIYLRHAWIVENTVDWSYSITEVVDNPE